MMSGIKQCLVLLAAVAGISTANAQQLAGPVVTVRTEVASDSLRPGEETALRILLVVAPGYHINSHSPLDPNLIPTNVTVQAPPGLTVGSLRFPPGQQRKFAFSSEPLSVYEDTVEVTATLVVREQISPGPRWLEGKVSFQACNDQACFPPDERVFRLSLTVLPGGESVRSPADQGKAIEQSAALGLTADEVRAQRLLSRGLPYAVVAFFVLGLALNLTPCVYPVLPITVSYFASRKEVSRSGAFAAALVYVVGIAIVFSALGLASGLAGRQWGFMFQSPWFVLVIALVILSMAASMFGAFEITVPSWLLTRVGQAREGLFGGFIMGLTVGFVIAPCAAGIIIGLVGLVAKLGMVGKGALLFFAMGLGLGLPYLVLATFSQLLARLPKSGMWMLWVRKLFGVLLIGVAIYFLLPQAQRAADMLAFFLGLLAIFGGLLLGFLDHHPGYTRAFKVGRAIFGAIAILLGGLLFAGSLRTPGEEGIDWVAYEGQPLEVLTSAGKPVFVEFYADWCAPCKQMERTTFRDARLIARSKDFVMLRVDCTAPDEQVRQFMREYQVTGLPTLVFLGADGRERTELREVGALSAEELIARLDALVAGPPGAPTQ
ncbi:MAG: thioredoxin family protein [candidate division KSB1 bacterium]|nr:thioredoxin family protein [candidate division KSB1 bacterium]